MIFNEADVFPGVAKVRKMISDGVEAVLVSRPVHGVGDSLPLVGVGASHHVVASVGGAARVGDTISLGFDTVRGFVPVGKMADFNGCME